MSHEIMGEIWSKREERMSASMSLFATFCSTRLYLVYLLARTLAVFGASRMERIGLPASQHLLHFLVARLAGLELPEPRGRCAAAGLSWRVVERRYNAATSPAMVCSMQLQDVAMESQEAVVSFLLVQFYLFHLISFYLVLIIGFSKPAEVGFVRRLCRRSRQDSRCASSAGSMYRSYLLTCFGR